MYIIELIQNRCNTIWSIFSAYLLLEENLDHFDVDGDSVSSILISMIFTTSLSLYANCKKNNAAIIF